MSAVAADTVVAGDVLAKDGGVVLVSRPSDVLGGEPTGCTVFQVSLPNAQYRSADYPNAQLVSLSNR